MNQQSAAKYIDKLLEVSGLADDFPNDTRSLLCENRRKTRLGNRLKFGCIDYYRDPNRRVHYSKANIDSLVIDRIIPIAEEAKRLRLLKK
ncbi:MAG: hypothetical protein Q8L68_03770 [Methylococcales bacterium]|nr:hypothetical protein [Methylococcales bacterium]